MRMSKRERVEAALKGEPVDRVPVSAWRHFVPEEISAERLAAVSLAHFREFDWDWLKLNPRATKRGATATISATTPRFSPGWWMGRFARRPTWTSWHRWIPEAASSPNISTWCAA